MEYVIPISIITLSIVQQFVGPKVWLKWSIVGLYIYYKYLEERRRGTIGPPCIEQFITICIGCGLYLVYKSMNVTNFILSELGLFAILICTLYVRYKLDEKIPKPPRDYLLTKYKKVKVLPSQEEECAICMDLVTFLQRGLQCKYCKKIFHSLCLRQWCEEAGICPHCRKEHV